MEAPIMSTTKSRVLRNWFIWGLVSLTIVALYGFTMRYKILFNLPFLEQKNLLHAHSHFAFTGWVSHVLFTGLAFILWPFLPLEKKKKYPILIGINWFIALGMLIAFTIQGYGKYSIILSTLSMVFVVFYTIFYVKDVNKYAKKIRFRRWAIIGLLLNILSSAGPILLAYVMITKSLHHNYTVASLYYYLHFQYNGWFFFGMMALVVTMLPDLPSLSRYLKLFAICVIPTYLLSILWAGLPTWLYVIAVVAIFVEFATWIAFIRKCFTKMKITHIEPKWIRIFFYSAIIAITLKFTLQIFSIIPSLSQIVFGFRPIIIAYLHLILLGGYTLFILGFFFYNKFMMPGKYEKLGAFIFLIGVILNELFLGIQGFAAFSYTVIPYINQMLLFAASLLFIGALTMAISQITYRSKELHGKV